MSKFSSEDNKEAMSLFDNDTKDGSKNRDFVLDILRRKRNDYFKN